MSTAAFLKNGGTDYSTLLAHATSHTLAAGAVLEVPLYVSQMGSLLQFQVSSVNGDIGVEIALQTEASSTILLQYLRTGSRNGEISIPSVGTCRLRLDNCHSWVRSKDISYLLQLHTLKERRPLIGLIIMTRSTLSEQFGVGPKRSNSNRRKRQGGGLKVLSRRCWRVA